MKRCLRLLFAVLFIASVHHAEAAGLIILSDPDAAGETWLPPRPPHIFPPREHPVHSPLELTSIQANATIKDQLATTRVEEEFYNPNDRSIEGTFLFPLPKGAHLDKFAMQIGGKTVEAELLDSDKARRLYEEIVRKVKDPALLEYAGRDLIKARIFPIEAHGRKNISLSYSELLKSDAGLVNYVFPLDGAKFSASPVKSLSLKVDLQTKTQLKSIYSPSHNIEVRHHESDRATIGFEASNLKADTDFQLLYSAEKDPLGFSLLTDRSEHDGYFLLLASPGFDVKDRKILPKDVIFVLDTSGSMAGAKLEQAKKALLFCVENLNENDRFEVIRFATETEPLFGKLTDSTQENRSRATEFIKQLKPIGGTAIDEALRKALSLRPEKSEQPFIIVFLTDGRPTVGVTGEDQILASLRNKSSEQGNTRIFCFGIGTDVNTHLLDKISDETRAFSQYVLPEEDLEVKVSSFFAKIKEPVLANLKLKLPEGIRTSALYPADLPDLFQGEQLVLVGRYAEPGDATITLQGSADGETKLFQYQAHFPETAHRYPFIPQLWANRRVGFLLDQIRLHGENQELRQEVTELARRYGIVTPYTAYLILEDETRRGVPLSVQSLPRLSEDRPAQMAARDFYDSANSLKSGDIAVGQARYGLALRQADNAQAMSLGRHEAERGFATTLPRAALGASASSRTSLPDARQRLAGYAEQSQFVNGRNFFLNGKQWVDATIQNQTNANHVQVQFNSKEYFALLQQHPDAASWLALGQNVQFALKGTVYEIAE